MREKVWKTFLANTNFILSIRVKHADRLCHRVLEMTPEEFIHESFPSFIGLYSIGANLQSALPKRLIRELNDLNWDRSDDLDLPGLPREIPMNVEVSDDSLEETDF